MWVFERAGGASMPASSYRRVGDDAPMHNAGWICGTKNTRIMKGPGLCIISA
jgi:hypothetical protein